MSGIRGFSILLHVTIAFWLLYGAFVRYYTSKSILSCEILMLVLDYYKILFIAIVCSQLSAFVSFILIKLHLIRSWFKTSELFLIHILWQVWIITCTLIYIRKINAPITIATFINVIVMIQIMKGHAFVYANIKGSKKETNLKLVLIEKLNMKKFLLFLYMPTLIYDVNYSTNKRPFSKKYFIMKSLCTLNSMLAVAACFNYYIPPIIAKANSQSTLQTFYQLILPSIITAMLSFHFMFEELLNVMAEITNFGDREFYSDWWNSTTFTEFSRKWNKPVHLWLHVHVYEPISTLKIKHSKFYAYSLTTAISAVFHELFLEMTLQFSLNWFIVAMLLQIPLYLISKIFKDTILGNIIFWFGIVSGLTMLITLYGLEWLNRSI